MFLRNAFPATKTPLFRTATATKQIQNACHDATLFDVHESFIYALAIVVLEKKKNRLIYCNILLPTDRPHTTTDVSVLLQIEKKDQQKLYTQLTIT